ARGKDLSDALPAQDVGRCAEGGIPDVGADVALPVDGLPHGIQRPAQELLGGGDPQRLAHADDDVADLDAFHLVVRHQLHRPAAETHDLRPDHAAALGHEDLAQLAHAGGRPRALDEKTLDALHHAGKLYGVKVLQHSRVLV